MNNEEDKEELKNLLAEPMVSTPAMAHMFFPHHVYRPFCDLHEQVFKILDDDSIRACALALPRGFGKTTLAGTVFAARKALFRDCHFIVYISCTFSKARNDLKTLANELQNNELLIKTFGDLKGLTWAEGSGEIELTSDIKIEAKGAGNQIRGIKYKHYRPDLIIIDDLEDPEAVQSEERRKKLEEWFFADVMNSIDLSKTRVVLLGTILHQDSLLANILKEKEEYLKTADFESMDEETAKAEKLELFHTIRLEACDDNLKSNWPEFISDAKIAAKYKLYKQRGLQDVFFREMRNLPMSPDGATFEAALFKDYEDSKINFSGMETVVLYDPAKTTNVRSDYTAVVGVSIDTVDNKIYFRDCVNKKISPEEQYKEVCDMADRLGTCNIGYEITSLNEFITYPLETYCRTRGRFYNLVKLAARGKKEDRIAALSPFYKMGQIYHNSNYHIKGPLEAQLLTFPRSKNDDVMDAFAYCIIMFDLGDRFFSQNAIEDAATIEAEYALLEDEDYEPLPNFGCAPRVGMRR